MKKANRVHAWVVLTGIAMGGAGFGCGGGGGTKPGVMDGGRDVADATDRVDMTVPTDGASETLTPGITPVKLMVSPSAVMVTEGSMPGTFAVNLSQPWSMPITVTLVSSNPNVATVIPETLTFQANKTGPETVMVLPTVDDDTADNSTTIALFSQETGSAIVTVEVDDMDVQGLLVSPPRVSMTEGRTETLSVRLAKRPASAVVVTLASSSVAKLGVTPPTLTFNAGNYSVPQLVMLSAAQDDDANLDNVTVNLTATGNIAALPVQVEITDDDAVNLDVTPPSLNLVERSNVPGSINVRLTRAPSADVTVMVVSSSTKATVSPPTLTFTTANFDTAQVVQVSAVADNDARDETASVTLTATGVTPAPPPRTVSVSIDDPDSQAIQTMPMAFTVAEGATATFEVRMLLDPGTTPVTVNVFSQSPGKIEVLPPVLTFSSTDFGTGKMVTVRSIEDEDLTNDSVNITLAASTAASVNVTATVTDNDTQAIQLIPATPGDPLVMQETVAGSPTSTSPLGVRLAYRPAAATTVTIASSDAKLTRSPGTLTFTPTNYAIAQFVTLGAPHDGDMMNDMAEIVASATGIPDARLGVQILDIDIQNFNVSTPSLGPIAEGSTAQFNVKLTVQPTNTVIASIASNKDGKVSVDPALCVFTAANYNTGCTVTVTAVNEMPDDTRDETATVSVGDMAGAITGRTVAVSVDDTDVQELVVSPLVAAMPPFTEGGTASFTVALRFNPVDPVVVSVFSQSPAKLEANPPLLNFNSGNFAMPQLVTVRALEDDDLVSESPASTPPNRITVAGLAAGAPNVDVSVTEMDNDVQSIVLTPGTTTSTPLVMQEAASTQIGVRLAFRPAADTVVSLASSDGSRLTVGTTSLTFTAENYSTTRFVTLTASHDTDMVENSVTVTATAGGIPDALEHVRLTDVDMLNFTVSTISLPTLTEGSSTSFTVALTVAPAVPVSPVLSSSNPSVTATFASACTLTASNFSSGCSVTVTAVEEGNALDESAVITVSDPIPMAPPMPMRPLASRMVSVSTDDNDIQALVLVDAENPEELSEGGGAQTFTVRLAFDPVTPTPTVTFTPSLADQVVVTSSPSPCVLTHDNYNSTGCLVTVTGQEDLDLLIQNLSVRVSAPGLGVPDAFVNVRKLENDTQQLLIRAPGGGCGGEVERSPSSSPPPNSGQTFSVNEDDTVGQQFCVSLAFLPDVTNTVTLTPSTALIGAAPGTLMFTSSNYFISQAVTVTGIGDADTVDVMGTVAVSVVPLAMQKTVTVTVNDNDRTLTVVPAVGGSVSSSPSGIATCTTSSATGTCDETYAALFRPTPPATLVVTLSTTPNANWEFGSWSGTGCGSMVTMSSNHTCTVAFNPILEVTVDSGMGTISATGAGGDIPPCSGTCTDGFTLNTPVTLSATPAVGWAWSGTWSGTGCSSGVVSMSGPRSCSTSFEVPTP